MDGIDVVVLLISSIRRLVNRYRPHTGSSLAHLFRAKVNRLPVRVARDWHQ